MSPAKPIHAATAEPARRPRAAALAAALACLCPVLLHAADLSGLMESGNWRASHKGAITVTPRPGVMGPHPGIEIAAGPARDKTTYASMEYRFDQPVDMSGLRSLSLYAKADADARVKISLDCEGGKLYSDFHRAGLATAFKRYQFDRGTLKSQGEPDLSQVKSLGLGFGLWAFDTRKRGFTITLSGLAYDGTETAYIIPLPKRGVAIDAQHKDWGFEDSLYNWTPPDYVNLSRAGQVAPGSGNWTGPAQLSGRFAFMMDETQFYFLALVADATPFQGANPDAGWRNDSVELFLKLRGKDETLRLGGPTDAQIVFDCGRNHERTQTLLAGRPAPVPVKRKTIKQTPLVRGRQTQGYLIEAAIPLKALGLAKRQRGALIGYSIKLNDSSGLSLIATPDNLKPHATCKAFRKAYVEVASGREKPIAFAAPAPNVFWPDRYTKGVGSLRIWDPKSAQRRTASDTAERLYLNSLWAVQSADSSDSAPDPDAWVYAPLPMGIGWYTPVFQRDPATQDRVQSREYNYSLLGGRAKSFFWYERQFVLPPDFRSGTLLLTFEYVVREATVYLNGQRLGRVDSARTTLDVTRRVKHGEPNRLDVLLYTTVSPGISVRNGVGIAGDIYLERHRHEPIIQDVWVKHASGLDGRFEVQVECKPPRGRALTLELECLDSDGRIAARTEGAVAGEVTTLSGACRSFKPWSPDAPNLFTLKLRCVREGTVVDERRKRFGFRTFEIRNARFMLNGQVLRLRAAHATNQGHVVEPARLRELKRYGHNSIFMHAGSYGYNGPLFDKLDEAGLVAFAPMDRSWPAPKTVAEVRRCRSHPCVLGYVSDQFGQLSVNGYSHNPFSVSDTYYPESAPAVKMYEFLRRRADLFRSLDPTRPYFPHATGNFEGSFRSTNHYPTFDLNLLDHMMYYAPWAERADPQLPYHLYECGVYALPPDILHPEHSFPVLDGRRVTRRLSYECASRYIGTRAFDTWRDWEAMMMRASVRGFRTCGIDGFTPWVGGDVFLAPCNTRRAQDIEDNRALSHRYFLLPYRETWDDGWMRMNSWYYSLRGQALWQWPARYGQGSLERKRSMFTDIYENDMQPLFAYIAGPPRDVFALEHNYYAGETIEKQIVAINDTEGPERVALEVAFTLGSAAAEKSLTLNLRQGEIHRHTVSFVAPPVEHRTKGRLRLIYSGRDGRKREDSFAVTVFPPHRPPRWAELAAGKRLAVAIAPEQRPLIAEMGLQCQAVSLERDLPEGLDLLIVERNALTKKTRPDALTRFIEAGGQALVLEQTEGSLLDWRLRERRLEAAFIADRRHPIVAGLEDEDLAYFRGPARIVPREKRPSRFYRHNQSTALDTPHLTNEGLVASYVFQKPCYGDFHPILVAGYDLEEAPLIEMRSGRGRVIFCQIDVTDRYGLDPAATRLVDNLVKYLLQTQPNPRQPAVAYVGGPRGRAFLDRLGIRHDEPQPGDQALLVVGDAATPDRSQIEGRARVVVLPFSDYLPQGLTAKRVRIQKNDYPHYWNRSTYQFTMLKSPRPAPDRLGDPVGEVFRGLVDNDAYLFESPTLTAFSRSDAAGLRIEWQSRGGAMVQARAGRTQYVLCSVDPTTLEHGECRRKAWRIWSMVFSNMGVANRFSIRLTRPALDMSEGGWTFLTDPDGRGEELGYAQGRFGQRTPSPIAVGQIWEEQGVNEPNRHIESAPDSAYDGFGWYFRTVALPASLRGKALYLHVDGVRDISTFKRTAHHTDLWVNGRKQPDAVGVFNAKEGGRGARLWRLDAESLRYGAQNSVAIRVFNSGGAGGIHRRPVRFEIEGQNQGMMLPYEFIRCKYTPYFFWAW